MGNDSKVQKAFSLTHPLHLILFILLQNELPMIESVTNQLDLTLYLPLDNQPNYYFI